MGRFFAGDADNYGNSGSGSSYFSLSDDKDVATVRFMYNSMEDISGYAVHEIEVGGKKRYVNCLRSYNEPKSKCPMCAANSFQRVKLYVPLYVISKNGDEIGEVQLWERGKTFFQKLSALCARYSKSDVPLVAHTFDIERHGKKGDTSTDYMIYENGADDTRLEDLPEIPEVLGTIIMDKSADELEYFLENGQFEDGSERNTVRDDRSDMPTGRRTPANSGSRGRREAF